MLLASEAGPWPKKTEVNLLRGKLSRAVATCLCLACSKNLEACYLLLLTPAPRGGWC